MLYTARQIPIYRHYAYCPDPPEIIDRVLDRRGHLHLFDRFEPNETALVVIDMQPTFVALGSPAEVPASRNCRQYPAARGCTAAQGVLICWVTMQTRRRRGSDWNGFFDYFVADDVRAKTWRA